MTKDELHVLTVALDKYWARICCSRIPGDKESYDLYAMRWDEILTPAREALNAVAIRNGLKPPYPFLLEDAEEVQDEPD